MLLRCKNILSAASLALPPAAKNTRSVLTRSLRRARSCSTSGFTSSPKGATSGERASSLSKRSASTDASFNRRRPFVLKRHVERPPRRRYADGDPAGGDVPQAAREEPGQPHDPLFSGHRAVQGGPLPGGPGAPSPGGGEQAGLLGRLPDARPHPLRVARERRSPPRLREGPRGGPGERRPADRAGDRRLPAPAGEARGGGGGGWLPPASRRPRWASSLTTRARSPAVWPATSGPGSPGR